MNFDDTDNMVLRLLISLPSYHDDGNTLTWKTSICCESALNDKDLRYYSKPTRQKMIFIVTEHLARKIWCDAYFAIYSAQS